MTRSLLVMLSQFPLDPSGGAVRSLMGAARFARDAGWSVRVLGTMAIDHADSAGLDRLALACAMGASVQTEPGSGTRAGVHRFEADGVKFTMLDTGEQRSHEWDASLGAQYDGLLRAELHLASPRVVLTMGALSAERRRQAMCRAAGACLVLGVRQHGYYDARAFEHVDVGLFPSRWLADAYRSRIGEPAPFVDLPVPMDLKDVVSAERDPVFITFVNPTLDKGVMLFARIAEELGTRRPDIPMLVIESRGSAGDLLAAGRAGGFDLSRHANLMIAPSVPKPRDIFRHARVLLVPSLWEEPSGRVIVEAMCNGVPSLVSDRGGIPETIGATPGNAVEQGGGYVLCVPRELTQRSTTPPGPAVAAEWVSIIERLCDDEAMYQRASDRARLEAKARFHPSVLGPRYAEFFASVRRR